MDLLSFLEKNKKTHLIFDFDYTLFKMVIPWEEWPKEIEKELSSLDTKIIQDYKQQKINLSQLQNLYVSKFGKKVRDKLVEYNTRFELNFAEEFIPNKELVEALPKLDKYKKFVWSSNTRPSVEKVLKEEGLFNQFEKLATRSDVLLIKPYTDGFDLIKDDGVAIKNYLFIGDSGSDKKAAATLGMDFYRVGYFGNATLLA